jgi:hypothetical protein
VLTPTQLSFVSVAALATPTSAPLKSSAAAVAMTAPLLLSVPIDESSAFREMLALKFASEIGELITEGRPFGIRPYYSFTRDFRHVSRARIGLGGDLPKPPF